MILDIFANFYSKNCGFFYHRVYGMNIAGVLVYMAVQRIINEEYEIDAPVREASKKVNFLMAVSLRRGRGVKSVSFTLFLDGEASTAIKLETKQMPQNIKVFKMF